MRYVKWVFILIIRKARDAVNSTGAIQSGCYSEKKVEANLQDLKNFVTSLGTPLEDGQYNLPLYPDKNFYVEHFKVELKK